MIIYIKKQEAILLLSIMAIRNNLYALIVDRFTLEKIYYWARTLPFAKDQIARDYLNRILFFLEKVFLQMPTKQVLTQL